LLVSSPSKILNGSGAAARVARFSRGNPSFAKPVQVMG
jgi:hypothetical protein